jgi:hypothetical protein
LVSSFLPSLSRLLKGAEDVVLRSKRPELVRQEFWGMLLAHYVMHKLMLETTLARERASDILSFNTIQFTQRHGKCLAWIAREGGSFADREGSRGDHPRADGWDRRSIRVCVSPK